MPLLPLQEAELVSPRTSELLAARAAASCGIYWEMLDWLIPALFEPTQFTSTLSRRATQHGRADSLSIINQSSTSYIDNIKIVDLILLIRDPWRICKYRCLNYAVHLYPQSTCDAARESRLSLNLLSDHQVVWTNPTSPARVTLIISKSSTSSC
jgi:hypothetical protein